MVTAEFATAPFDLEGPPDERPADAEGLDERQLGWYFCEGRQYHSTQVTPVYTGLEEAIASVGKVRLLTARGCVELLCCCVCLTPNRHLVGGSIPSIITLGTGPS